MLEKLEAIYRRWQEIEEEMNDPAVMSDMKRYVKLSKDYKDLTPIVEAYKKYKRIKRTIWRAAAKSFTTKRMKN